MSDSKAAEGPKSESIRRWEVPAIDGTSDHGYLTAGRMQELQQQAWDEAYAAGREEGITAGGQEAQRRAERFDQLLIALAKPFDNLDETVEKQGNRSGYSCRRHGVGQHGLRKPARTRPHDRPAGQIRKAACPFSEAGHGIGGRARGAGGTVAGGGGRKCQDCTADGMAGP